MTKRISLARWIDRIIDTARDETAFFEEGAFMFVYALRRVLRRELRTQRRPVRRRAGRSR